MSECVNLCDICDFQGGAQPPKKQWIDKEKDGYIRMLQIRDFTQSEKVKPEYVKLDSNIKTCCEDDILIARYGASLGKILTGLSGAYNVAIMKTIPDTERLSKRYLYYFLLSERFQNVILNVGSRAAQAGFNKADLQGIKLQCPSLKKQEEICKVLDQIGSLLVNKKCQLNMLDDLIKSRFIEMFGDPEINPMRWKVVTVGEVILSSEAGWSGNGKQRKKLSNEIAVLKVSAVTKGYFVPEEYKVLDDQKNIKKFVYPQKGDLLFSRANTQEMVGATAIITKDYPDLILPDKLWKIRFTDETNVFYMKYILSSKTVRKKFSAASTGTSGSMYNVSMDKFRSVQIPLPPLELQNQFAAFVQQTDKSKFYNKTMLKNAA